MTRFRPRHREGRITVASLLRRSFAALVVLTLLGGAGAIFVALPLYLTARERMATVMQARSANADMKRAITSGQLALDGYLLTSDLKYRQVYWEAQRAYPQQVAELRSLTGGAEAAAIAEVAYQTEVWWSLADRCIIQDPAVISDKEIKEVLERFDYVAIATANLDSRLTTTATNTLADLDALARATLIGLAVLTAIAVAIVALIGWRATRRITTPLGQVVNAIDELARENVDVHVDAEEAPAEIAAVAEAVNEAADRSAMERRLLAETRNVSVAVRGHLSGAEATSAATRGLGHLLNVDHVLIRPSATAEVIATSATWSAPDAVGDPTTLVHATKEWPINEDPLYVVDASAEPDSSLTGQERDSLRAAGAGPAVTAAIGEGDERIGHLMAIKRLGHGTWTPLEIQVVRMIAADLGRALTHARLYAHEQELVQRLQDLDAAKTEFLSNISHDLRTPLTSVAGYLEVLLEEDTGPLNPTQTRMLTVVDRNVERLRMLIEDLLVMSRIESATMTMTLEPIDVGAVLEGACQTLAPNARMASVAMTYEVAGPLPLLGDRYYLDRMFMNVLSNAVKFTLPEGRSRSPGGPRGQPW
ncbi:histidine kinase dimerization/phospho-acceptor domain-containing protein [Luedemannella flava]